MLASYALMEPYLLSATFSVDHTTSSSILNCNLSTNLSTVNLVWRYKLYIMWCSEQQFTIMLEHFSSVELFFPITLNRRCMLPIFGEGSTLHQLQHCHGTHSLFPLQSRLEPSCTFVECYWKTTQQMKNLLVFAQDIFCIQFSNTPFSLCSWT